MHVCTSRSLMFKTCLDERTCNYKSLHFNFLILKKCGSHLRLRVLSETSGLIKSEQFFSPMKVPNRYQVLKV